MEFTPLTRLSVWQRSGRAWSGLVGGLPRAFWTLWVGTVIDRIGCFVVPFLALYLVSERGFSEGKAGLIVSLHGAGGVGAGLIGGVLADRLGRQKTALIGLLSGACAIAALGMARGVTAIALLTFATGLLYGLYRPAVSAMVVDLVPPSDRQRAFNLLYWAINLGISVSLMAAGLLARHGFLLLFCADAASTLLFALVLAARVPETRPPRMGASGATVGGVGRNEGGSTSAAANEGRRHPASLAVVFSDRVFLPFVGLTFLLGCVFSQWSVALPLAMHDDGLSPATYGRLMALNGVLIVVLQPFAPRILTHMRRSRGLALAALLVGLGFGLNALADTAPTYAIAIAIWTMGEIANAPIGPAIVADLAPTHLRGSYQGLYSTSWGLAAFAGPALGGWILQRWGEWVLWSGLAALGLVVAAGHLAIAPARRRRLAELVATATMTRTEATSTERQVAVSP